MVMACRRSQVMVPGTRMADASTRRSTGAVRTPRFCTVAGSIRTTSLAAPSSAYLGTICMPIGDRPGLSKCCCGTIVSYQYRTCRVSADAVVGVADGGSGRDRPRSEEHTSELQSLMRISYAVFCLKKTKNECQSFLYTPNRI